MSEAKHTPGPWTVERLSSEYGSYRIGPAWKRHRAMLIPVAIDKRVDRSHGAMEHGEHDANARVIAAAPDLLEAAKGLLACLADDERDATHGTQAHESLRAAIAKAEGDV